MALASPSRPQRDEKARLNDLSPGSELAREIRKIRPDIPIVLMSGCVTPAPTERARTLGIAEVLPKPLVQGDMARGLAKALQRSLAA